MEAFSLKTNVDICIIPCSEKRKTLLGQTTNRVLDWSTVRCSTNPTCFNVQISASSLSRINKYLEVSLLDYNPNIFKNTASKMCIRNYSIENNTVYSLNG